MKKSHVCTLVFILTVLAASIVVATREPRRPADPQWHEIIHRQAGFTLSCPDTAPIVTIDAHMAECAASAAFPMAGAWIHDAASGTLEAWLRGHAELDALAADGAAVTDGVLDGLPAVFVTPPVRTPRDPMRTAASAHVLRDGRVYALFTSLGGEDDRRFFSGFRFHERK